MSSPTRLVVLGAVQQYQPVYGYFLRRELMTWRVDEWANIQPGSIYSALRSLEKDGFVVVSGTETEGNRPARTTYEITPAGEVELLRLLRDTLWNVQPFDRQSVNVIASFMFILSREEVIAGLQHRVKEVDALVDANDRRIEEVATDPATPDYVREIFELCTGRLRAEQVWARELAVRLSQGEYTFRSESLDAASQPESESERAINGQGQPIGARTDT